MWSEEGRYYTRLVHAHKIVWAKLSSVEGGAGRRGLSQDYVKSVLSPGTRLLWGRCRLLRYSVPGTYCGRQNYPDRSCAVC